MIESSGPLEKGINNMHEASYLSLSAMAERTDHSRTEGLSFMSLVQAALEVSGSNPAMSLKQMTSKLSISTSRVQASASTLSHESVESAFIRYREFLQICYPFIDDTKLKSYFDEVKSAFPTDTLVMETPEKVFLVYVGVATGILLGPGYLLEQTFVSSLFNASKQLLAGVFERSNDVALVQCLTSLTIHSLHSNESGSAWHLLGLAVTRSIACGLHMAHGGREPDEDDEGHRAYWSLYILDTYLSDVLDRPYSLVDHKADVWVSIAMLYTVSAIANYMPSHGERVPLVHSKTSVSKILLATPKSIAP